MMRAVCSIPGCEDAAVVLVHGHALCDRHGEELADQSRKLHRSPMELVKTWMAGSAVEDARQQEA